MKIGCEYFIVSVGWWKRGCQNANIFGQNLVKITIYYPYNCIKTKGSKFKEVTENKRGIFIIRELEVKS